MGVSLAHSVALTWKSSAWVASFSVVSMYHAAAFLAPAGLKHFSAMREIPSYTPVCSFSDIGILLRKVFLELCSVALESNHESTIDAARFVARATFFTGCAPSICLLL